MNLRRSKILNAVSKRPLFWLGVFFLFFFLIGKIPVWSPDEGRFAGIAREMWESKDFVVPRFNYVEHFEKPVLAYFLTALSIGVWGVNSLGVRFPSIFSAILGIFLTHIFTKHFFDKNIADLAAIVLTTSVGYFFMGRYGMIDMLMTLFLSAALFSLGAAVIRKNSCLYLAAYFFMALALITKGLIGVVLPVLVFVSYLVWTKNLGEIKHARLGWGLLIIGIVFIPWGIAISMREPEFSYVFFIQQQFERFATGTFGRSRPFWFFIPIFAAFAFPWSIFLPTAAIQSFHSEKGDRQKVVQFLICWIAMTFIFFSIPKSKLPYYILPVSVPMAVLVAIWFHRVPDTKFLKTLLGWTGLISVLALAGLNAYLFIWAKDPRAEAVKSLFLPATLCAIAGCTVAAICVKKNHFRFAVWAMGGTLYVLFLFVALGMSRLTPYLSTYGEAKTLKALWKEGDTLVVYSSPDHFSDLPFHLQQRITMVGSDHGTLTQELKDEEHSEDLKRWFLDSGTFLNRFNSRENRMFCLMKTTNLHELERLGLRTYKVVMEGAGKLLVSNEIPKLPSA
jgi:4-amino-4-deoxy-L-arabinose transferase-like glycosyltransferase